MYTTPPPITTTFPNVICADAPQMPSWALGDYNTDTKAIIIRPMLCTAIARAQANRIQGRTQTGMASLGIFILAHELAHERGIMDTNITTSGEDSKAADCAAWQTFPTVAKKIGIRLGLAIRLGHLMDSVGKNACK